MSDKSRIEYGEFPVVQQAEWREWIIPTGISFLVVMCVYALFLIARHHTPNHFWNSIYYDSPYYFSIARHGIPFDGNIMHKQATAFLPGYSLLLAPLAALMPHDPFMAMTITSLVLSLIGATLFFRLISRDAGKVAAAAALAILFSSPYALYFFNGYSGPAFFATATASVYLMRSRRWAWAAFFAGYAALSRPYGIAVVALVPIMVVLTMPRGKRLETLITCAFWGMLPALAYTVYMYVLYGDSLLYVNAMEAWKFGNGTDQSQGILGSFKFYAWLIKNNAMPANWWAAAVYGMFVAVFSVLGMRRMRFDLGFLVAALLLFELVVSKFSPVNSGRHVAMMFPCALGMALLFYGRQFDEEPWSRKLPVHVAFLLLVLFQLAGFYVNTLRYFNVEWVS
jgi:hypothetical protein